MTHDISYDTDRFIGILTQSNYNPDKWVVYSPKQTANNQGFGQNKSLNPMLV